MMREQILDLLQRHPSQSFPVREVARRLEIPLSQRAAVRRELQALAAEGKIQAFRNQHYGLGAPRDTVVGVLSVTRRGVGFVSPEGPVTPPSVEAPSDVRIARENMASALPGDRVEVHVVREQLGRREGYVVKVLQRHSPTLVGRFLHQRKGGLVLPRDSRIDRNVVIAQCSPRPVLKDDQWVVVRITQWTAWPEPLYGRIEEILGTEGDPGLDVLLIVRDHGVTPDFPKEVEREAAALAGQIDPAAPAGRRDLRNWLTVTIDPERAKDFDDAVSLERADGGHYRLGVHIADVSHYVAEGSAIDREALERGLSIYPVDRVIPMLPERLSSDLCSLRPRTDRLAMSVVMELTAQGRLLHYEVFRSVIRSRHRLTYRQVQDLFDGAPAEKTAAFADAHEMLVAMRELAATLATRRTRQGSLDLDIPETEVLLDAENRVLDVRRAERLDSHRLIEQFMILANEVVARHLRERELPAVYRIHEPPDPEKLERLRPFLQAVGVRFAIRDEVVSQRTIQHVIDRLREHEAGAILHTLVLRTMMRAVYSPRNLGHYGLASDCYCHFTSPIRRYPDLAVHRALAALLDRGKVSREQIEQWNESFDQVARQATEREERANQIERDTVRVKSVEFMRQFVGEEFEGIISGVTSFGFFVELRAYPVEGLVHVRDLRDDFYRYEEEALSLVGESGGRRFRFGDKVTVAITRVDLINLDIDLVSVDQMEPQRSGRKGGRRGRRDFASSRRRPR